MIIIIIIIIIQTIIMHLSNALPRSSHDPGAITGGIYVMESVFLRMWALPKRTILCTLATSICPGISLMYLKLQLFN